MKSISIIIITIISFCHASGQSGFFSISPEKMMQNEMMNKMSLEQMLQQESFLYGNSVIPELYFVGPGDILSFQNLSYSTTQELITVNPDRTVYIPRIGTISAEGLTLKDLRDSVFAEVKKKNKNAMANLSLFRPRMVMITVKGNVMFPGIYTLPSSFRVSSVVALANQANSKDNLSVPQSAMFMAYLEKKRAQDKKYSGAGVSSETDYSTRNILIIGSGGSSKIADIEKAKAAGVFELDPYIQEGDEVILPYEPEGHPVISVTGSVNRPAFVAFKEGDKASLLLNLGYGLKPGADTNNIILVMPGEFGAGERIPLKVTSQGRLIGKDYELAPGSSIIAGRKKNTGKIQQGVVSVIGRVHNEGAFLIKPDETRVSEVIEMAGGFTDEAYLPLAYILRQKKNRLIPENQRNEVFSEFRYTDLTMEDTTRFTLHQINRTSYVSCDFAGLFEKGLKTENVTLQDGDLIVVPSNPKSVYVYGLVNNPGYVAYEEGRSFEWYIEKAGGYAKGADEDRTRIIRGKTKVWIEGGEEIPVFAGDEIYVPAPPDVPPGYELSKTSAYASLVAGAASIITTVVFFYNIVNN